MSMGKIVDAKVVDHEPPHNNNIDAFFDERTWRSLCKRCHDSKTSTQDGGFGNRKLSANDARKPRQGCDERGLPIDANHHWRR